MSDPKRLTNLSIDEVSIVDDPANQHAHAVIVKANFKPCADCTDPKACSAMQKCSMDAKKSAASAASTTEVGMTLEEAQAALTKAQGEIASVTKERDEALTKAKDLESQVSAKDGEIAKLKNPPSDEDVLKALPEPVRKMVEESTARAKAAEEAVAKMAAEREESESIAKAKELGVGDPTVLGPVLMRIGKGKSTADDQKLIEQLLKASRNQSQVAALFKTVGSGDKTEADPHEQILAKANELKKADPALTDAQAYTKAVEQNPDLYQSYVNKRRSA